MKRIRGHFKKFFKEFRGEILISSASTIIGILLGTLVHSIVVNATIIDLIVIILLSTSIIFMIGLSFIIKKNLTWKIRKMESLITEIYGGPHLPTQYSQRLSHFEVEKELLAKEFVKHQLPALLNRFYKEKSRISKIALVIDSGTTLAPMFPKLKYHGFSKVPAEMSEHIDIYTNSLSGVEAFNLETGFYSYKLEETDLHLLGGNPLEKYRATTGVDTIKGLNDLRKEYCLEKDRLVIGIITANWILITQSYNKLFICARGRGHYDFKKKLAEISDKIIIVSPLGKILKLNTVNELNQVLEEEKGDLYDGFEISSISKRGREDIFFITTIRTHKDSLLYQHSRKLLDASIRKDELQPDFTLVENVLKYNIKLPLDKQIEIEVPHHYLLRFIDKVFK